jgi:hypothetical protein
MHDTAASAAAQRFPRRIQGCPESFTMARIGPGSTLEIGRNRVKPTRAGEGEHTAPPRVSASAMKMR